MAEERRFKITDFADIPAVPCPCGMSRRVFAESSGGRISFHVVEISTDARVHYHKNHIEIYYILEGSGFLEVDGEKTAVKPGMSILIKEYCRHRSVGKLKIVNVSLPAFDPEDEWFD